MEEMLSWNRVNHCELKKHIESTNTVYKQQQIKKNGTTNENLVVTLGVMTG